MGLSLYGSLPIIRAGGVPCHCRIRLTVMAPGSRTVRLLSLNLGVVPKTKASRNQAVQEEQQTGWHERHSQTRHGSDNTNRPTSGSAQASGRAAGTVIEPGIANIRHSMTYQHVSPSTANHIRLSHLRHAFCTISTMPPPQTGAGQPTSPITRQALPVRPPQPRFRRRICCRPYPRPALRHRRQSPGR